MGKINVKSLQKLCLNRVLSVTSYWQFKKLLKKKNYRVNYTRKKFMLSSFSSDECKLNFRFTKEELHCLIESLNIPRINWLKNRIKFSGEEGLCLILKRLSYPNRFCDLVPLFNRDGGSLSQIFTFMINWLYSKYAKRLHSFKQNYLTRSYLQELAEVSSENGCPYPNIIGFIDGTCRPICRPTYNQKKMYSGYKKQHVCKYQSVVLVNGLIGRLDGPIIGRRHDSAIIHLSRILDEMNSFLTNDDGSTYAVYGDAGYSNQKFIKVGFKNQKTLSRKQKHFNRIMSSLRVGVEYGFGQIVQQFSYVDFKKSNKIYLSSVKKIYYVAAFLVNCQSCIRGRNQISDIFDSYVPTIHEYMK